MARKKPMKRKQMKRLEGQGASEYLILLGVVLIVAIAAMSLLGFIPPLSSDTSITESRVYWRGSATPVGVYDTQNVHGSICGGADGEGYRLVLTNAGQNPVGINSVFINGDSKAFCKAGQAPEGAIKVEPGQTLRLDVEGTPCALGKPVGFELAFNYDTPYLTGKMESGAKKLMFLCGNASAGLEGNVTNGSALAISPPTLPDATELLLYGATLHASGGSGGYSWNASGLPAGLAMDGPSGVISGTPEAGTVGTYAVDVTVLDSSGSHYTKPYQLTVIAPAPQNATLTVIKQVINDNGGTLEAANFTMQVTGSSPSPESFPGNESGTHITIGTGSYSVNETDPGDYQPDFSSDCSGTIAAGENKICIITNNDLAITSLCTCGSLYSNNNYRLDCDISNYAGGDCFTTYSLQNITFDCQGHTIDGTDQASSHGFFISNTQNLTIKNCVVTDFERGIQMDRSSGNTLTDITAASNVYYGIKLFPASSNNTLSHITVNNNNEGLAFYNNFDGSTASGSNNNVITDMTASGNADMGIFLYYSTGNSFTGVTTNGNGLGIMLTGSPSNAFSSATSSGNLYAGLGANSGSSGNRILSSAFANNLVGIHLTDSIGNYFESVSNEINYSGGNAMFYSNSAQDISSRLNTGWFPFLGSDGSDATTAPFTAWYNGTDGGRNYDGSANSSLHYWYNNSGFDSPLLCARDDFNTTELDTVWVFAGAGGSSYSLTSVPGHLQITAPSGTPHDCWPGLGFDCPRVLQNTDNSDTTYETRIDGEALANADRSTYGIMLYQDDSSYIRFEYRHQFEDMVEAYYTGSGQEIVSGPVSMGSANYLRVAKSGSSYTLYYTTDGSSWINAGSLSAPGFTVNKAGLYVINAGTNPTTTGNFDYFSCVPG